MTSTTRRVLLTRPARPDYVLPLAGGSAQPRQNNKSTPSPLPPIGGREGGGANQEKDQVEQALSLTASMTSSQRQELLARLSLELKADQPDQTRDLDMWATAVHESLQDALGAQGGASTAPMLVKRAVATREAFAPISEFMARANLKQIDVQHRLQTYRMLADMLVSHSRKIARRTGAPLSAKLVANCSPSIAALFDAAFPGYLRAGLAQIVVKRLTLAQN